MMKQTFPKYISMRHILLCGMIICCLGICAQDSIVVYSDTTSALMDAEANDSLWQSGASADWDGNVSMDDFFGHNMFGIMSGLMGITGILAVFIGILFLLLPLIAIGVIIYLIYRLNTEKRKNALHPSTGKPEDTAQRTILQKERAISQLCWGVGLLLVNWIADITMLLNIAGVILICMGIYSWLNMQIRK